MGGRGASSGLNSFYRNVKKAEDRIRNEPYEHFIVFDSNGNSVFPVKTDGKPNEVTITDEMKPYMRNAVATHNHPRGTTFSWQDVDASLRTYLRELRATTPNNGTYVLRRKYEIDAPMSIDMARRYSGFAYAYRAAYSRIVSEIHSKIDRGEISSASEASRLEAQMRHEWLVGNSSYYGWEYKIEK